MADHSDAADAALRPAELIHRRLEAHPFLDEHQNRDDRQDRRDAADQTPDANPEVPSGWSVSDAWDDERPAHRQGHSEHSRNHHPVHHPDEDYNRNHRPALKDADRDRKWDGRAAVPEAHQGRNQAAAANRDKKTADTNCRQARLAVVQAVAALCRQDAAPSAA